MHCTSIGATFWALLEAHKIEFCGAQAVEKCGALHTYLGARTFILSSTLIALVAYLPLVILQVAPLPDWPASLIRFDKILFYRSFS